MSPMKNEQKRNIKIVLALVVSVVVVLLVVGALLYFGDELPPSEMRNYYSFSTGYAPPPNPGVVPAGTVARGALTLGGPGEAHLPSVTPSERALRRKSRRSRRAASRAEPGAVPLAAERLKNPLASDPQVTALGERDYSINCAMCHGEPGQGIGPVGESYIPRPPNLAEKVPAHSDGYLYYVITYGIRSTPSPETARYLPQEWHAFRTLTSAKERWAIISYMRKFFGATPGPR